GGVVGRGLEKIFAGQVKPISDKWIPDALAVSGFTREQTLAFDDPTQIMTGFARWLAEIGDKRLLFVSAHNGFDWPFINWDLWHLTGVNPFGHSSTNLGSLYKGLVQDTFKTFKHLRVTPHTHDPLDDARGNAEALLEMKKLGLKIAL